MVCRRGATYSCWNCGYSPIRAMTIGHGDMFRCTRCDEMMLFMLDDHRFCIEPAMADNPPKYIDNISCWRAAIKEVEGS